MEPDQEEKGDVPQARAVHLSSLQRICKGRRLHILQVRGGRGIRRHLLVCQQLAPILPLKRWPRPDSLAVMNSTFPLRFTDVDWVES